jgi:hypothetical protein
MNIKKQKKGRCKKSGVWSYLFSLEVKIELPSRLPLPGAAPAKRRGRSILNGAEDLWLKKNPVCRFFRAARNRVNEMSGNEWNELGFRQGTGTSSTRAKTHPVEPRRNPRFDQLSHSPKNTTHHFIFRRCLYRIFVPYIPALPTLHSMQG